MQSGDLHPGALLPGLAVRLLLLVSPRAEADGFEIAALNDHLSEASVHKIREALRLIADVDAALLRRMERDVKRIMLVRAGGPEYWPFAQGFILTAGWVTSAPIEQVAFTIVHEATHARLWRSGFRYGRDKRRRLEEICIRAEARFAALLPDGQELSAEIIGRLLHPWWTDQAIVARQHGAQEKLWPRWLLRLTRAMRSN